MGILTQVTHSVPLSQQPWPREPACDGDVVRTYFNHAVSALPVAQPTLWFGRQDGHPACKNLGVGLSVVTI